MKVLRAPQASATKQPWGSLGAVQARPVQRLRALHDRSTNELVTTDHTEALTRRSLLAVAPAVMLAVMPAGQAAAKVAKKAEVDSVSIVKDILQLMPKGDVEGVLAKQAKDVVWKFPVAYSGDPLGGEFRGKYGVLTYLTRQGAQRSGLKLTDVKVTPGDGRDQVVARFRMSGKQASSKFSTSVTQVWRVSPDGLVASMTAYYDTASLAKAAGIKAV